MSSVTRAAVFGTATALVLSTASLPSRAATAPKGDAAADVATLNAALPLARAAVKAYADAAGTNILSAPVLAVTKQFAADHQAHADAIVAAITQANGTPSSDTAPPTDFSTLKSEADILGALYGIERATAAAYLAALGELKNRDLARSTGAMLGVVTTHVALLAEALRRGQPYPTSFVTA